MDVKTIYTLLQREGMVTIHAYVHIYAYVHTCIHAGRSACYFSVKAWWGTGARFRARDAATLHR